MQILSIVLFRNPVGKLFPYFCLTYVDVRGDMGYNIKMYMCAHFGMEGRKQYDSA